MDLSTLFKITYGMYIVSSKDGNKINAQLSNTVVQISPEPPTMLISVSKKNLTHEFIEKSKIFTINIISDVCEMKDIGQFGFRTGRDFNKFSTCKYKLGNNGAPVILDKTIGYVECDVINEMDCGTHTVFIGKITNAEMIDPDLEPMTYDHYSKVLKGKLSKNATHYQKEK
ncbi:MAG: flavin reductase [Candidatus Delongbacteria bacterium]|nr:flavin reductase [Candidatus Delongbacteria bacterium]